MSIATSAVTNLGTKGALLAKESAVKLLAKLTQVMATVRPPTTTRQTELASFVTRPLALHRNCNKSSILSLSFLNRVSELNLMTGKGSFLQFKLRFRGLKC